MLELIEAGYYILFLFFLVKKQELRDIQIIQVYFAKNS